MLETTPLHPPRGPPSAPHPRRLPLLLMIALSLALAGMLLLSPSNPYSLRRSTSTSAFDPKTFDLSPELQAFTSHTDREAEADTVTFVPGFGAPLETQYAGLLAVNKPSDGRLFFWFFEKRGEITPETPLLLWLNGGPGVSSMEGLLTEVGPYRLTARGTLIPHAHSWTGLGHVLFLDQPVGTGYSSVRDEAGYVHTQEELAAQVYTALQHFMARHPQYAANPLYLCGQSYAGKYVPSIAFWIHRRNEELELEAAAGKGEVRLNLVGIAIGNGVMWPVLQTRSVPDFAIALGLIDSQEYEHANAQISTCEEFHRQGRHIDAFQVCQDVQDQIYQNAGNPYIYDIRKSGDAASGDHALLTKYFNDEAVRAALHVPPGTPWQSVQGTSLGVSLNAPLLVRHLQADEMLDVPISTFRDLLDNYRVLFYAGNMDGSQCNNLGVGRTIDRLAWSQTGDYRVATRHPWTVNGQVAGLVKSTGNMSFVVVMNAGHRVPTDQPEAAFDMMRRYLTGETFFTAP